MSVQIELNQANSILDVRARVDRLRGLAEQYPANAPVWFNLACDLVRIDETEPALRAAARCVAIDPFMQDSLPSSLRSLVSGPASPESLVGTTVSGFQIERIESHSEIQVLYRARKNGQAFTLRVLPDVPDAAAERAFREELALYCEVAQVTRPLDLVSSATGRPVQVLPYLAGRSLAELSRLGFFGTQAAVTIARALAPVLDALHQLELVHGALVPDSVIFNEADESVSLLGLRKSSEVVGLSQARLRWLSPEVGTSTPIGPYTDVYGVGALLYFASRRKPPPRLGHRLTVGIPTIKAEEGGGGLESVIQRALSLQPSDRFATLASMVTALDAPVAAVPPPSVETQLVAGRFRCMHLIGEGHFGVVYKAVHVENPEKWAAVKVVSSELSISDAQKQAYLDEAQAVAKVEGPHVVQLFDSGKLPDGSSYLVMELLRGDSLFDVLHPASSGAAALEQRRALTIAQQTALGLQGAHSVGVVHRDLKPENIFLDRRGAGAVLVKLLDFGIARLSSSSGIDTRSLTGTPPYMAPEQWDETEVVDPRTDLYALGVLLYEMLTGSLPYPGPSQADFQEQHRSAPIPELPEAEAAPLRSLVRRLMSKEMSDRPASALEVVAELEKLLAPPVERPEPVKPRPIWKRAWFGAAATLLVLGAVGGIVWAVRDRQAPIPLEDSISLRPLMPDELFKLSPNELRILRNVPYARTGYPFSKKLLVVYFSNRPWYVRNPNIGDPVLSVVERNNLDLLGAELERRGEKIAIDD